MPDPAFRLAIVGAGPWAVRYAATVAGLPDVSLTAVVSQALATGTRPIDPAFNGAAIVADFQDLDPGAVDGAVVAVPPPAMDDICARLIDARLPFLAEKPLTLSARGAADIAEAAGAAGVPAMVDLIYLFNPGYQALKARIDASALQEIESAGGNQGPFRDNVPALWDWGPHDVAMILDLVGAGPVSIRVTDADGDPINHVIRAELAFPGGQRAAFSVGNRMAAKTRRLVCRTKTGDARFDEAPARRVIIDGADVPVDPAPPLATVVQAFAACARGGGDPLDTLNLACRVNRVLERVWVASEPKLQG